MGTEKVWWQPFRQWISNPDLLEGRSKSRSPRRAMEKFCNTSDCGESLAPLWRAPNLSKEGCMLGLAPRNYAMSGRIANRDSFRPPSGDNAPSFSVPLERYLWRIILVGGSEPRRHAVFPGRARDFVKSRPKERVPVGKSRSANAEPSVSVPTVGNCIGISTNCHAELPRNTRDSPEPRAPRQSDPLRLPPSAVPSDQRLAAISAVMFSTHCDT